MQLGEVADHLDVEVPVGGRVLLVSDMHLAAPSTSGSLQATRELALALKEWTGPGVLVLLGDILELVLGPAEGDPAPALAAHPDFVSALHRFSEEPGRRIVYLAGNHDGRLAWDAAAARTVAVETGATLCLSADLVLAAGHGVRRVRLEHGHQLDPPNAFRDQRNPCDIPLGHHVAMQAESVFANAAWLCGMEHLADPSSIPNFIASRLAYRRIARYLAWLVVPLLLALAITWSHDLLLIGGLLAVGAVFVGVTLSLVVRQLWGALTGSLSVVGSRDGNCAAQLKAEALVQRGYSGFITGHTHRAELRRVGDGFYANTGCCDEILVERPARLGLPPVFAAEQERTWLELEVGDEPRLRLYHTRTAQPAERPLERLASRRRAEPPAEPVLVAEYPFGPSWPQQDAGRRRLRRFRYRASGAMAWSEVSVGSSTSGS